MRLVLLAFSFLLAFPMSACAAKPKAAAKATPRPGWKPATKTPPARKTVVAAIPKKQTEPKPHKNAPIVAKAQAMQKGTIVSGRKDCTGFVLKAYEHAGIELEIPAKYQTSSRMSEQMYLWARGEGRAFKGPNPKPGDVVFFRDTYGTIKGDITHVALVEKIESDGTIVLIHRMSGSIRRDKMSLAKPEDPAKNGYFRKKLKAGEPTTSGQLFVAFGRFDGPI